MARKTISILIVYLVLTMGQVFGAAQPGGDIQYEKAVVLSVTQLQVSTKGAMDQQGQNVKLQITSGAEAGKTVDTVNYFSGSAFYEIKVSPGDKVIVAISNDFGKKKYYVSDFDRFDYVYLLLGLFIVALLICGGKVGFKSIIVIAMSGIFIFKIFLGLAFDGKINLTLLVFITSALIATFTQTIISGFNAKTFAAIIGTIGGVAIAGFLSIYSIQFMHLTGLESEEAMMLKAKLAGIDFQGILFAGMVIGALGAVMDVAISISSSIYEVKKCQTNSNFKDLFATGMNVGRDVMGTMSNTLILAYVGSSLPLLLLILAQKDAAMLRIMNLNMIVTEIVRAMTGSIGLIFAIPITAFVAAYFMKSNKRRGADRQF